MGSCPRKWSIQALAKTFLVAVVLCASPICSRAAELKNYRECDQTDSDKAFFAAQIQAAPAQSAKAVQDTPCKSTHSKAFSRGFELAFTASRYRPTVHGEYFHPGLAFMNEPNAFACSEFQGPDLACCDLGYREGEKSFLTMLEKTETPPSGCSEAFRAGQNRDGSWACDAIRGRADLSLCPLPTRSCQQVCFAAGWKNRLQKCLGNSEARSTEAAAGSASSTSLNHMKPASERHPGKSLAQPNARTAK